MIKVRTFTTPIKIFATQRELQELDDRVSDVPQRRERRQGLLGQRHDDRRRERRDHRPDPHRGVRGGGD